jgi:Helix-turn-helix domain
LTSQIRAVRLNPYGHYQTDLKETPMSRGPHPAAVLLAAAGPTVGLADAAKVLSISRAHAYALAKRGELGVRVLRLGNRWVVPTAELRRAVGLGGESDGPNAA